MISFFHDELFPYGKVEAFLKQPGFPITQQFVDEFNKFEAVALQNQKTTMDIVRAVGSLKEKWIETWALHIWGFQPQGCVAMADMHKLARWMAQNGLSMKRYPDHDEIWWRGAKVAEFRLEFRGGKANVTAQYPKGWSNA